MLHTANIFVTGGAGTLGRAIARRRQLEGWTGRMTIYSRDEHKHSMMRSFYPDIQFVQGDIRNLETLKLAMVGHDVVLHLAACKVIPVSEYFSLDTIDNNIYGSMNVCMAARETGVKHVLGISTDKAAHPVNAYGATKMLMEKIFAEYARAADGGTQFHLLRYGNVLESSGSVIEAWKNSLAQGKPIKVTDPSMTRFFLSPQEAVTLVKLALNQDPGITLIPRMPSLSIGKLAEYTCSVVCPVNGHMEGVEIIPLRPGEKAHEDLLTVEETEYTEEDDDFFFLHPTTDERVSDPCAPYSSDIAPELSKEDLMTLLKDEI